MESQKENRTNKHEETKTPTAVNWHCFKACNYACEFCYARFEDLKATSVMAANEGYQLLEMLASAGVEKINFVGGEPMLHPHIETWIVHAKSLGLTTSIVSNGTNINEGFLQRMKGHLDWIGLSIDASNDDLHADLGRGLKGDIAKGISNHLSRTLAIAPLLHAYEIGVKLNTVVTSLNVLDDMTEVVRVVRPHRWKIFQALPIEGENDDSIEELSISKEQFDQYVMRHRRSLSEMEDCSIVAEDNEAMLGTYAMIDPIGRVYTNAHSRYKYSSHSCLVIGFIEAWNEVSNGFDQASFVARDGQWDWNREPIGGVS
ncbi:MAG: viperin family antiviral radical SAM protein [Candidatus Poseidoniaceae archaeon]